MLDLMRAVGAWIVARMPNGERGAVATEYAVLIALMVAIIALGVGLFGTKISSYFVTNLFNKVGLT